MTSTCVSMLLNVMSLCHKGMESLSSARHQRTRGAQPSTPICESGIHVQHANDSSYSNQGM